MGNLQLPPGASENQPLPAIVFLGPLTSVKEQVPGNYADALATRGFVTLAIDNRHFGESEGEPRQYEHPGRKVEDIEVTLDYLSGRPEVNSNAFAAVGICAGAGYMAGAVAKDSRIKAFGAVAGFFHDVEKQKEWMGDGYDAAIQRAKVAKAKFEEKGESDFIPAVGEGDVAMPMAEAYEYYGTSRGNHSNYRNAFALMSREQTLTWDAQSKAPEIQVPTLMIHSENALAPGLARHFIQCVAGPTEERWMQSKGQIDFYDDPKLIGPAADELAKFFKENLG